MRPLFYSFPVLFFSWLLFLPNAQAAHILGGYMSYECMGNDNYKFKMVLYRDCFGGGAPFDSAPGTIEGTVTIYKGSSTIPLQNIVLAAPSVSPVAIVQGAPCSGLSQFCVEEGIYTFEVLLSGAESYHVVYQRCCGANNFSNLENPAETGMTIYTEVTPSAMAICNNSPTLFTSPLLCALVNQSYFSDFSFIDADGDVLTYEFCPPFDGGGTDQTNATGPNGVAPDPDLPPPFSPVTFANPFTFLNPIPSSSAFSLDANTGLFKGTPTVISRYIFGYCINEFRNGQLLSSSRFYGFMEVAPFPLSTNETRHTKLKISPNPASTEVFVELPQTGGHCNIELIDISERKIREWSGVESKSFRIATLDLPSGIYFIKASTGQGAYLAKLVISK